MGAIAMRRTKNQMVDGKPIVELPERNVYVEHVKLSEEERSLYDAMQNEGKIIVSRLVRSEWVPYVNLGRPGHWAFSLIVLRMAHYCFYYFLDRLKAVYSLKKFLEIFIVNSLFHDFDQLSCNLFTGISSKALFFITMEMSLPF